MYSKSITYLSVVCPVYNEEGLIEEFVSALDEAVGKISLAKKFKYELIFVDDGSNDGTLIILKKMAQSRPYMRCLVLSRNFGHQKAISSGMAEVRGDAIVVMDSDFQDHPGDILTLVDKYLEGYDVVYAIRSRRKEMWLLRLVYFLYYRFLRLISYCEMPLDAGDFSIISRRISDFVSQMPEYHKYIRGLRAWAGFRQTGVKIERHARSAGKSKYSIGKLILLASSGLYSFSLLPLRIATFLDFLLILLSAGFFSYALIAEYIWGARPPGYSYLIFIILSFFSINLFILGIIGEYIGRIYEEVKRRPSYLIYEKINFD